MSRNKKPVPNEELKKLLSAIKEDPGAVDPDVCALPTCNKAYTPPWDLEFHRPDVEGHPTRSLSACSSEHHQAIVNFYGLGPFMTSANWY